MTLILNPTGMHLQGLWLGMGGGLSVQTIALISILLWTNWDKLVCIQPITSTLLITSSANVDAL